MNGTPMQKFNAGDAHDLRQLMPLKIREIQKKRKSTRNTAKKIYCETNHSFIKGWGYLLPDQYIPQTEIGVIVLRRDLEKTAYSLLRIRNVPGCSEWSRTWLLMPNAERDLSVPANEAGNEAGPYDLCKWYVKETYLRAQAYKEQFPNIRYIDCELEQLNSYDFVLEMFAAFGLEPAPTLKAAVGNVMNRKSQWEALSLEALRASPKYPSADTLQGPERDALIAQMVSYIKVKKADRIAEAQPDLSMGGSLAMVANAIVSEAEQELEAVFEYSLPFTETEGILIWELLREMNPRDLLFLCCQRISTPAIQYTYDFNQTFSIAAMAQELGLLHVLQLMVKGIWGKDYTHRKPTDP